MQRIKPTTGQIYHIYNRGVEKRKIFLKEVDYVRFIHDLFEFNDENPAGIKLAYHARRVGIEGVGFPKRNREPRKLLIELYAFSLMPNHFHFMVRQKVDGGITEFMRKIGTGYTNYFNNKYDRVGPLFQGRYKMIRIANEGHFIHLPYYIHLNALDLSMPKWREQESLDYKKAMADLEKYRWSSYLDYIGKRNFPSVSERGFLLSLSNGTKNYKQNIINWLRKRDLDQLKGFLLE